MDIQGFYTTYSGIINVVIGGFTVLGFLISAIVLYITFQTWKLKCGEKVRGEFDICSGIESSGYYINNIILENLKDKDLVIKEMYIRFGRNIYLDMFMKDTANESYVHIIPPLSTIEFKFGPAFAYTERCDKVTIQKLLHKNLWKNSRIILITNEGKLTVKRAKKGWSPEFYYFKNYGTEIIRQHRYYSDNSVYGKNRIEHFAIDYSTYGDKTLYLVKLSLDDKKIVTYPIYEKHQVVKFQDLKFSNKELETCDTLRQFIEKEKEAGNINYIEIKEIIDFQSIIREYDDKYHHSSDNILEPKPLNWFQYNIICKVETIWYKIYEKGKKLITNRHKTNQ